MDHTWYTVAEYLVVVQAAKCSERQGVGAPLACVSRLHRQAVAEYVKQRPLRVYCATFNHYKLPTVSGFLESHVSFCNCLNGFECALNDTFYQKTFFKTFSARCFKSGAARYTACLAYSQGDDRCLACRAVPAHSDDNIRSVVVQKHSIQCKGCLRTEPTLCNNCRLKHNLLVTRIT